MVVGTSTLNSFCDVIGMVASPPQSNVITPPISIAASNASSVQLAGVPVPTTEVGCEVSTGWIGGTHSAEVGVAKSKKLPIRAQRALALFELSICGRALYKFHAPKRERSSAARVTAGREKSRR